MLNITGYTYAMNKEKWSILYDIFMICVIFISLLPLLVTEPLPILMGLDTAVVFIFGLDYLLQAYWNYRYCFTLTGLIDFLTVFPLLPEIRFLKLFRLLSLLRPLKLFRFYQNSLLFRVLKKQKTALLLVLSSTVFFVFLVAIFIFYAEPQTFDNFYEAFYWSAMTLTSVGYGDIVPHTYLGRAIAMSSIFFGTAFVAIPSGIIAAGYMDEITKN